MEKSVYINGVSAYLPNSPIANEEMEDYIGKIGGNPSRVRSIVLRQNGIRTRYYGLDKNQNITHSNARLAKEAVYGLFENRNIPNDLTLLACGTSTPDQLLPSHASMVHGELGNFPMEIFSSAGVCLTSLQALKICYSNILAGLHQKAVCVASELTSPALVAKFYDPEYEVTHDNPDKDPYMAFEKDFMRFMLSDGAGAVLLQDHPEGICPLRIEWVDMTSYANELPTCMFMASELQEDGRLKSWKEFSPNEIKERAVLVGKQDIRQLKKHIIKYWVDHIHDDVRELFYGLKENVNFYPVLQGKGCSATHLNSFLIGPLGELYKCWNELGDNEKIIGFINEQDFRNKDLIRKYVLSANCFEDEKCKDCEFIPICMGGCAFYRIKNMFDNANFDICSLYKDDGVIEKCICLHLDKLRS